MNRRENKANEAIGQDRTLEKVAQSPFWDLAKKYVELINSGDGPRQLANLEINEFAKAQTGEVYQISHIATSERLLNQKLALYDFKKKGEVPTNWSWHFATVVAVSGTDRVTLENYARGDNRQSGLDPRWYFQMYGTQKGQSFHEQANTGKDDKPVYANPVTVVHRQNARR